MPRLKTILKPAASVLRSKFQQRISTIAEGNEVGKNFVKAGSVVKEGKSGPTWLLKSSFIVLCLVLINEERERRAHHRRMMDLEDRFAKALEGNRA